VREKRSMNAASGKRAAIGAVLVLLFCNGVDALIAAELPRFVPTAAELEAALQRRQRSDASASRVYKAQITPHWFDNNRRFWYRNDLRGGGREFMLVDAVRGGRTPAFDHDKLAAALSKAAGKDFPTER